MRTAVQEGGRGRQASGGSPAALCGGGTAGEDKIMGAVRPFPFPHRCKAFAERWRYRQGGPSLSCTGGRRLCRGVLSAVPFSRCRRKGAAEVRLRGLFGPCAAACAVCRTAAAPFGEAGRNAGLFAARFSEEGGAFAARRLWNAKWHQESICSPRSAAPSSFWRSSLA